MSVAVIHIISIISKDKKSSLIFKSKNIMIFIHIRLKINQVGPTGKSPKNVLSKKSFKKSYTVTINPFVCISLIFVSKVNPLKMKNGITNCFTSETQNLPPNS